MERPARISRRGTRIGGLAALLAAALAGPAGAAPGWVGETPLTGVQTHPCSEIPFGSGNYFCNPSFLSPRAALAGDGAATAVWASGSSGATSAMTAFRPAGGTFSPPDELAATANGPLVGVDDAGNTTAVWNRLGNAEIATRPAGGSFGATDTLATGLFALDLDVAPNGAALVTFLEPGSGSSIEVFAAYRPPGGTFGTAVPVSPTSTQFNEVLAAIDANGDAVIAWTRVDGSIFRPEAVRVPAGGPPGTVRTVAGATANDIDLAMNGDGDAVVAWYEGLDPKPRARFWPAGGELAPSGPALSGSNVVGVRAAISPDGEAFVAWSRAPANTEYVTRPPGGTFSSTPTELSSAQGQLPLIEFWPDGDALAVWGGVGPSAAVVSAVRPAGGSFGAPLPVYSSTRSLFVSSLAVDPAGNAAVTWVAQSASNAPTFEDQAFIEGFDGAPPVLDPVSIPTTGRPGQSLAFSATAADVWSSVGPVTWDFGDGTTTTGSSVSHAYGAEGAYTVEVSATDGLDQTATVTRTVTVAELVDPDDPAGGTPDVPDETPDANAPEIESFTLTNRRFRVGRRKTAVSGAKRPLRRGTKFVFELSEAGTATFTVQRAAKGRRVRGKCRRSTRKNRDRPRCTRWVATPPRITRAAQAGENRVAFSGRYGKTVLRPGRHRVALKVDDAAGNRSATRRAKFRVVR